MFEDLEEVFEIDDPKVIKLVHRGYLGAEAVFKLASIASSRGARWDAAAGAPDSARVSRSPFIHLRTERIASRISGSITAIAN
jgi:hypothetical protein